MGWAKIPIQGIDNNLRIKYPLRQRLVRVGSAAIRSTPYVRKQGCRDHNAGREIPPPLALFARLHYTEQIKKAEGMSREKEIVWASAMILRSYFGTSMREVGLQLTAAALTATTCEVRAANRGLTPVSRSSLANWLPTGNCLIVLLELSGAYRTKKAFLG